MLSPWEEFIGKDLFMRNCWGGAKIFFTFEFYCSKIVSKYIDIHTCATQYNGMLFKCIINSISLEGKVKFCNRSKEYHVGDNESGLLLSKVILDKSGLKTYATVMKQKAVLFNLPEIIMRLIHNVSKMNSHIIIIITHRFTKF